MKAKIDRFFPFLIFVPLILSGFVHLWNPIGTPEIDGDEGHYYRRAINTMQGAPAEEVKVLGPNPSYDNPFFGQIFLASVLTLFNYPASLSSDNNINANSVGALFLSPRVTMGILAVIDTFLLFKIAERRYGIFVALISSMLFAVMPFSLEIRRVFLETLQLPLILSSVLFALYFRKQTISPNNVILKKLCPNNMITIFISGIFLGLAIFTKIPAFNMIPLIGILIYFNNKNTPLKALSLWLIPVVLIPAIWPLYAVVSSDFDKWLGGISYQTNREGAGILSIRNLYEVDPILVILGISGSIFAFVIRRDYFSFLWIIPYFIFFSVIAQVTNHNYIPLLPAFCLGGGLLIVEIYDVFRIFKSIIPRFIIPGIFFISIIGIGFAVTVSQIMEDLTSTFFALYSAIIEKLPTHNNSVNDNQKNKVTIVGDNWIVSSFSWIPDYLYHNDHEFVRISSHSKIDTKKVLFVVDARLRELMSNSTDDGKQFLRHQAALKKLYDNSDIAAKFNFTTKGILSKASRGQVEIRTNY